jgi:hypothetical protein
MERIFDLEKEVDWEELEEEKKRIYREKNAK